MVFSSIIFTFIFLPIVLLLYYLAKEQYRNPLLFVASIIFYATGEPKFVFVMLASIVGNYLFALLIDRMEDGKPRRGVLAVAIAANLALLFFYKYLNFSINIVNHIAGTSIPFRAIALPIGISFFTFQAMSYVIDIYRREAAAERNILNVGLYIALFPQLIAGPIVRYNAIAKQIKKRTVSLSLAGEGAMRFICGYGKKVILSNNLAIVAESVFDQCAPEQAALLAWFGSLCYTLQIFFDFSGYSDMAIGLGKMFGFEFEENFRYPYMAESITEFWRRWHISLSRWFRDYVYIPLGGSRVSVPRHICNLLIVWLLTGLWHGARMSYVLWGLWYFLWLLAEKYVVKPWQRGRLLRVLWRIVTLLAVNTGWILFRTESVSGTIQYLANMFGRNGNPLTDVAFVQLTREYGFYCVVGILLSMPLVPWLRDRIKSVRGGETFMTFVVPVLYLALFLWAVSFLILGLHNPFIYFNF